MVEIHGRDKSPLVGSIVSWDARLESRQGTCSPFAAGQGSAAVSGPATPTSQPLSELPQPPTATG